MNLHPYLAAFFRALLLRAVVRELVFFVLPVFLVLDVVFVFVFFLAADFLRGILAPEDRASFKAIAMACLRFFTLGPLPE